MAYTLRHYQEKAINNTFEWLQNAEGNPLIVLPTGTGKSLVIAEICRIAMEWPDSRVIIATHSQELVEQNYLEFDALCPMSPAGIYSSGLKRKEKHARILFCGIQSVYKEAFKLQKCDMLLIDEAHTISRKGESMWGQFINDLLTINPDMRIIGLTATPFRLDSGHLIGGEGAIFHDISYEYNILDAVREGYLCEVVPKSMATKLDVSQVKTRGGEFIAEQLDKAVNIDAITKAALNEVESYGADRRSWLIFGCGVKHAEAIHEELKGRGYKGAFITGNTGKEERAESIRLFKEYKYRYLVNNMVLTTGFNHKGVDLIADLAPTGSAGLHVQKIGRGTRTEDNKKNCVLLDFAENVRRHGAIDKIKGKSYKEKDGLGVPPMKDCPECDAIIYAGMRVCPYCSFKFPPPELNIKSLSDNLAIFSHQEVDEEWIVDSVTYSVHKNPNKEFPVMKVTYQCGLERFFEWICFEHSGFAREKAVTWFLERSPVKMNPPKNVQEMVDILSVDKSFKKPTKIWVTKKGKFWNVTRCSFEELPEVEQEPLQDWQHESIDFQIPI